MVRVVKVGRPFLSHGGEALNLSRRCHTHSAYASHHALHVTHSQTTRSRLWQVCHARHGRGRPAGLVLDDRPHYPRRESLEGYAAFAGADAQRLGFDFPSAGTLVGHVYYVTFDPGSLAGKTQIVVRYRVDAGPEARFAAQDPPGEPATVWLVIQRSGDNRSARGRYNFYRWYAPPSTVRALGPGVGEITVSLSDPAWVAVQAATRRGNEAAFDDALADASRVGLVFGSAGARGHGVFATAPARFTLFDFNIR